MIALDPDLETTKVAVVEGMAPTEPAAPLEAPLLNEAENAEPPMPKGFWKRELRAIFALAAPCIVTTCSSQVNMTSARSGRLGCGGRKARAGEPSGRYAMRDRALAPTPLNQE